MVAELSEFVPFRFKVSLYRSDSNELLCAGSFSEVTGFELTMEPRVIKEGGLNWGEHQRSGPTKFSPIILKRGVTTINDLWTWFDITTRQANYGYRLTGEITVLGNPTAGQTVADNAVMVWKLTGVLPTKFKGPDLNATASQVAIEELQLVHEGLELQRPAPANA
ncbi:phage tail protein [uncultured Desulfobulbus sp.]|uniref:phage tail protein n=1 Tax=uncultured Desulfobulbus sp. TaxID=239745 RepID=UPI0029C83D5A|nr:phage tail protein [uncultured Desulfobulbus sp.]